MPEDTGKATYCISMELSYEVEGEPGHYRTYYPKHGPNGERQTKTILSVQPNGDKDTRLVEQGGAWETWKKSKDGNRAIFPFAGEPFAFPLVD